MVQVVTGAPTVGVVTTGTRCAPPELSHCVAVTPRQAVIERSSSAGETLTFSRLVKPWVLSMLGCCGTPMSATFMRVSPLTTTPGSSGFTVPVSAA